MTTSLVIGSDESVLEGIAQALAVAGARPHVVRSIAEAAAVLQEIQPLLEQRLAAWKAPAQSLPVKQVSTVPLPTKPRIFLVNRTGATASR